MEDPSRELVEAVAALDESACFELIRRAEPLIQAALGGQQFASGGDREEVVQDVRRAVLTSAARWNPTRSRFSTWVYAIVRNVYHSYLRRQERRPTQVPFSDMEDGFDPPDPGAECEDDTSTTDLVSVFRRVSEGMSEADRTVIEHMMWHGDGIGSHADLAKSLGVTDAAAKQRVYRMKKRLTEAIEAELRSERDLAANKQGEE